MRDAFPDRKPGPGALRVLLLDVSLHFTDRDHFLYDLVEAPLGLMNLLTCLYREYGTRIHGKIAKSKIDFDSFEELRDFERSTENTGGWRRVPAAVFAGNTEHGSAACGAIAGIINDIPTAKEVIDRMVGGYEALVATL